MALIKETSYNGMARCGLVNTLMYTLPHMRVYSYSCMSTRREVTLALFPLKPTRFELFAMFLTTIDLAGIALSIVPHSTDSRYLRWW